MHVYQDAIKQRIAQKRLDSYTHLCEAQHGSGGDGVAVERLEEALSRHGLAHGRLERDLMPDRGTILIGNFLAQKFAKIWMFMSTFCDSCGQHPNMLSQSLSK